MSDDYEWKIRQFIQYGADLTGRETIAQTVEKQFDAPENIVRKNPQRCLEILIKLITSPSFQSTLDDSGKYWRERIEFGISEVLEICAELNRANFIETIAPLLSDSRVRSVIKILDDANLMEQLEEYNRASQR